MEFGRFRSLPPAGGGWEEGSERKEQDGYS